MNRQTHAHLPSQTPPADVIRTYSEREPTTNTVVKILSYNNDLKLISNTKGKRDKALKLKHPPAHNVCQNNNNNKGIKATLCKNLKCEES